MMYFIIFLFGISLGSFLNVIIYRLPKDEKISGRSRCPHCKKVICWYDLIPVFSFIMLSGKCRYCHQKISLQYPLVEIATGILFLLIFNFQFSPQDPAKAGPTGQAIFNIIYLWLIACFLVVIFVVDLKHYIIPDKIIYPAIGIAFLYQVIFNFQFSPKESLRLPTGQAIFNKFSISNFQITNFYPPILSALGAAAFFLVIVLVSHGHWMGLGDVKLAGFMGLFLGWPNILMALFLAFGLGAIIGLGLVILGKKKFKSEIPFGPFLVAGTLLALFWGKNLIDWYLATLITS